VAVGAAVATAVAGAEVGLAVATAVAGAVEGAAVAGAAVAGAAVGVAEAQPTTILVITTSAKRVETSFLPDMLLPPHYVFRRDRVTWEQIDGIDKVY
jgi:hypothetical protein